MSYDQSTTQELIRACIRDHGPGAWGEFLRRFSQPLAVVVFRVLNSVRRPTPDQVDDVVQHVLLKLLENDHAMLRWVLRGKPESTERLLKIVAANAVRDWMQRAVTGEDLDRGRAAAATAVRRIRAGDFAPAPRATVGTCLSRFGCPHAQVCSYGGQPPE